MSEPKYKSTSIFSKQPREWSNPTKRYFNEYTVFFYGTFKHQRLWPFRYLKQLVFADSPELAIKTLRRLYEFCQFYRVESGYYFEAEDLDIREIKYSHIPGPQEFPTVFTPEGEPVT